MKVWIDQDLCTGDGLCEEIAPAVFTLLDDGLADAVEANCQSKLCFALPPRDAHRMAAQFAPRLDEGDLRYLGRYRVACRISQDGRQLPAEGPRFSSVRPPGPRGWDAHRSAGPSCDVATGPGDRAAGQPAARGPDSQRFERVPGGARCRPAGTATRCTWGPCTPTPWAP